MSGAVALAADERLTAYDFGPEHPMAPRRLPLALSLMRHSGVLTDADLLEFGPADTADLRLIHDQDYLDALTLLSADPGADPAAAVRFGFVGDNEPFWGMDEVAREIAGATVAAVDAVAEGRVAHAFSPMGGLHHARRRQASGFCLVNDVAVAIARCTRRRPWRVLYVDLDVHHGDGVQAAFYDDPRVLTVSLHETGRHLWPGSGDPYELGEPPGVGRSINLPLEPYTDDQGFLDAFDAVVAPLAATFRPDLLVSQDGCDGHAADPLADLHLTTGCFRELARRLHAIAHRHCQGRWVATGGGGYEVDRVVPRAWTLLWAVLADRPLPPGIPERWREAEAGRAKATLPTAWEDSRLDPVPVSAQVRELNARTVRLVRRLALPLPVRAAYPAGAPPRATASPWTLPDWEPRGADLDLQPGRLVLRDRCPGSLVRRLAFAPGLHGFGPDRRREREALADLADQPGSDLAVAHTMDGTLVAYLAIVEPEPGAGLHDLPGVVEVGAMAVTPAWRSHGLGRRLLEFAVAADPFEDLIVCSTGLPWHWDVEASGLPAAECRDLLDRLHRRAGFAEAPAGTALVGDDPTGFFLVRVGSRAPSDLQTRFRARLRRPARRAPA